MVEALQKKSDFTPREGPVLLLIMDGIGYGAYEYGDAAKAAYTPHLDLLHETCPNVPLKAHGTAVGLPSDKDMGNSEVGHNAIGSGRVFPQGAQLVNEAIESERIFEGDAWKELSQNCLNNDSTLHLMGLFSDGTVHSHIDHVKAILRQAASEGVTKARVHILLDGRDVGETSALEYVEPFEEFLQSVNTEHGVDYRIASGGGRPG